MGRIPDLTKKEDRLEKYLHSEAKGYLFDQLSEDYLRRSGMEFLKGVSVPLTPTDLVASQNGEGISVTSLADNMAVTIGANPRFPYVGSYMKFFAKCFSEDLIKVFTQTAGKLLTEEQYRRSVIYFRAAMLLDPEDKMAVFGYACACRQWYLSLEGDDEQELVAILKSEAKEYFEWTTELYPDFAGAWYYLGFAWLNEGQYTRAQLIWKRFIALSENEKDSEEYKEIEERLEELKEPVNIERGVNELYAGRFEAGLKILEPYTQTKYNSWWPLHFYLAGAYLELGCTDEAIEGYRKVLELSPSNADAMRMLAKVYAQTGDADMAEKYERKAGIVSEGSGKDDQNTGN